MSTVVPLMIVVAVILAAGVILLILPGVLIQHRASRDYRQSRGTHHRLQIEQAVRDVRALVGRLLADVERIDGQVAALEREELDAVDQALARHLVMTTLDDVPGLGPARVTAIIDKVFQSQLTDLHTAHLLPNIGPATQSNISRWVDEMQSQWPQLRSEPFPGKQQVLDRFSAQWRDLEGRRTALTGRIATLQALEQQAMDELLRLSAVTVQDFRRALAGHADANQAEGLKQHLLGAFAP